MMTHRKLLILTMGILICAMAAGTAFAFSSDPGSGSGGAPYGVANANSYAEDAAGTRVIGVLFIEYMGFNGTSAVDARVTLRLRKGNKLVAFHSVVEPLGGGLFLPKDDPGGVLDAIVADLSDEVAEAFGGTGDVRVKEVSEFITIAPEPVVFRDDPYLENCFNDLDDNGNGVVDIFDPACNIFSAIVVTDVELSLK
jgi:hypothetical protein